MRMNEKQVKKGDAMKKAAMTLIASMLFTSPVHAADWMDVRPGTFVGARLTLGGKAGSRPTAAVMIAPTQNRTSFDGMTSMKIGEGIALNFNAGRKPTFTLAGVRADQALGLASGPTTPSGTKLGMSDGAKVAIGVGAALAVAAGAFLIVTHCDESESSDDCP